MQLSTYLSLYHLFEMDLRLSSIAWIAGAGGAKFGTSTGMGYPERVGCGLLMDPPSPTIPQPGLSAASANCPSGSISADKDLPSNQTARLPDTKFERSDILAGWTHSLHAFSGTIEQNSRAQRSRGKM